VVKGVAAPPPVPGLSFGGGAAGIPPYRIEAPTTRNPPTTVRPSALLSVLNKADQGFNQAITHFEQGTPMEAAAIDILEVALGSQKLDSQAKLLGHVDRAFGLDNLQRLQRWANTGGALDLFKEQIVKIAKNYKPKESVARDSSRIQLSAQSEWPVMGCQLSSSLGSPVVGCQLLSSLGSPVMGCQLSSSLGSPVA